MFIARAGEITFTTHLVPRSAAAAPLLRSALPGSRPRPRRSRRAALLGPGGRTRSRARRRISRGTRTTATRSSSRSSYLTCWVALIDATLENGCPWSCPACTGAAPCDTDDDGRLALPRGRTRTPCRCRCAPAGSPVLRALTPHATGPNRIGRGAQGVHRAARAGGRACVKTGRRDSVQRPGSAHRRTRSSSREDDRMTNASIPKALDRHWNCRSTVRGRTSGRHASSRCGSRSTTRARSC